MTEPEVELAEPPKNITATRTMTANSGQRLKSAPTAPVVVIIETAWKSMDGLFPPKDVFRPELDQEEKRSQREQGEVKPKLLVANQRLRLPAHERPIEQREVRAREHHEDHDHPLRRGAEGLGAAGLGREAAGGQRRRRVCQRLEGLIRSSTPVPGEGGQDRHRQRQTDVERPEAPRIPDPGGELELRPGAVLEQLAPADAQPRQHGEREDDDPHAPEPLGQLAPDQQRVRKRLDVGEHRGAGGRLDSIRSTR